MAVTKKRMLTENALQNMLKRTEKAKRELKESEGKFKAIFNKASDGILVADASTKRFALANPAICRITGYAEKELLKLGVADIHPKKDLPYVVDQFTKQLQGKIRLAKDIPVLRKDGGVVYCDVNSQSATINGKPYLVGLFRDVTERNRAEEDLKTVNRALRQKTLEMAGNIKAFAIANKELIATQKALKESEERHKALFDSSRDAIMTLEPPSWRFTSGNPATVEMFACKDEADFVSRGPWQYSPPKQPDGTPSGDKAKAMIMRAMEKGSNFFEWTHRTKDGKDFPATVLLTRMTVGGKTFLQATVRDLTKSPLPAKL